MLTHRDTEAMENLPTCTRMPLTLLPQCEVPDQSLKHKHQFKEYVLYLSGVRYHGALGRFR